MQHETSSANFPCSIRYSGKNGNGRVCCLVKCSVVTKKNSTVKGASSESLPAGQLLCDKHTASDSQEPSKDSNETLDDKVLSENDYPMPSCSYQVVKPRPIASSVAGLPSRLPSRQSSQSCPSSAPTSSHSSPRHASTQRKNSAKSSVFSASVSGSGSSGKHPGNAEEDNSMTKETSHKPSEGSPSVRRKEQAKHDCHGNRPEVEQNRLRSPRLSSAVKRSRRHTIASETSRASNAYPEGGFRYMAGYSSLTMPGSASRDQRSPSTSQQSSPIPAVRSNKSSPKRQAKGSPGKSRSPKL